ncbi:hypothetical protein [Mycolicibacterium llatzerense]|uniref:hypothetical protein n=1 Tax=Mycolicibacterium llatzerense TaxID=280871 RepID=UPI0021B6855F|nr:hypothetical protein [Mycolicibacterium llatzerense]
MHKSGENALMRSSCARRSRTRLVVAGAALCAAAALASPAGADPSSDYDPVAHYDQPKPLPAVNVVASNWQPQFPFPYDQWQQQVTPADITAEREMCQWYNAQYTTVRHQIEGLNDNVVRHNGDFNAPGVAPNADIVAANVAQSAGFLAPRAQALTQAYDHAGDMYYPVYQGDAFYGLWQQMSNLSNGLAARQPTWFTGPSFHLMQFWGSKIHRSHICE